MKTFFLFISLISYCFCSAQKKGKFSFLLKVQPEISFYKNNYSPRNIATDAIYTKSSFNAGAEATIQYNLTNKLFAETGLGFISRKLNANAFLNQQIIPPPKRSETFEIVPTKSIALRTIRLPLNIGYNVIQRSKMKVFLHAGVTANFLLNTYYETPDFKQYTGVYRKNIWQGYTVHAGVGNQISLSPKLILVNSISYSFINRVKQDVYLYSRDTYGIVLDHKFLQFSAGLKVVL